MAGGRGGREPLLRAQREQPPHEVHGSGMHAVPVGIVESVPAFFKDHQTKSRDAVYSKNGTGTYTNEH